MRTTWIERTHFRLAKLSALFLAYHTDSTPSTVKSAVLGFPIGFEGPSRMGTMV